MGSRSHQAWRHLGEEERWRQPVTHPRSVKRVCPLHYSWEPWLRLGQRHLAWHVLGRWHLALADVGTVKRALAQIAYVKLPPAKHEDAVRCFEKAIALNPNRLMHYIEFGCTYAQMGRDADARKCITKGIGMTETEKDDPETKELGRQILKKLR